MSGFVRGTGGCLGAFFFAVIWQVMQAVFHGLSRGYVVMLELITGIPNWPSYSTSGLKLLGMMAGFLAYLGVLSVSLQGLGSGLSPRLHMSPATFLIQFAAILLLFLTSRFCFRRML